MSVEVVSVHPPECDEPPRMFLFEVPVAGSYWLLDDLAVEFIALDVDGTTLLVSVESTPSGRAAMAELAHEFFATWQIGSA